MAVHWADRLTLADVDALIHQWGEHRDWYVAHVTDATPWWQRDVDACEARVAFWGLMRTALEKGEALSPYVRAFVARGRAEGMENDA